MEKWVCLMKKEKWKWKKCSVFAWSYYASLVRILLRTILLTLQNLNKLEKLQKIEKLCSSFIKIVFADTTHFKYMSSLWLLLTFLSFRSNHWKMFYVLQNSSLLNRLRPLKNTLVHDLEKEYCKRANICFWKTSF